MALTFPANPVVGQTYTEGQFTYAYDGVKWTSSKRQITNVFDNVAAMTGSTALGLGDYVKVISPLSDYVIQQTPADYQLGNGLWAREITAATATPLIQPRQTGDGTTTTFDAPGTSAELPQAFFVVVNGLVSRAGTDYITAPGQIIFTTAPAAAAEIDVTYFKPVTTDVAEGTDVSLGYATATGGTTARTLADRAADVVNVKDFGAVGDGVTDDTAAIQSAVDFITTKGNITYGNTLFFPAGIYIVSNAIQMYECDGIVIQGAGKYATIFQGADNYSLQLNATFSALNGAGTRGYTYNEDCIFMIAASRRLASATDGADLDEGRGLANATAQWGLTFRDFRVKGHTPDTLFDDYTISGIYGPSFAHSHLSDIEFQYVNAGIHTNDIYRTLLESIDFRNAHHIINHATIGTKTASGTSLTVNNCGASRVLNGWSFFGLSYSAFTNATVDDWGWGVTSGDTPYAYSFNTCLGTTLTSCGAENSLFTDASVVVAKLFYARGTETMEVNGMNLKLFGYDNSSNQKLYDIDGTYVSFEGCSLPGGDNSSVYFSITGFAKVDFRNAYVSSGQPLIPDRIDSDGFANINFDSFNEPYAVCYVGNTDIPLASGANIITFNTVETNSPWGNTQGMDNGDMVSTYEVEFNGSFLGDGLRWAELKIGSVNSNLTRTYANPADADYRSITLSTRRQINPNNTVRLEVVTQSTNCVLKAGSVFKIKRIAGRVD